MTPRLSWNRLDLAIKISYLQARVGTPPDFARETYDAHLAAFSLGDMTESGNAVKSGAQGFRAAFDTIADDIARDGFDPARGLVPLARDGSIPNGAHRTAAAMIAGRDVAVVETGLEPIRCDHAYFRQRGMAEDHLRAAALKYAELSPRATVALLWPAARGREREVEGIIGPLVYKRAVALTPNGAHNLLSQVYAHEPWLGLATENHSGVASKLSACFSGSEPLRVLLFDAEEVRDLVAMKDQIRALYGIGKHSIHITDSHAEALSISRRLLNPGSVHFLNHARPNRFAVVPEMVAGLKDHLARHGIPRAEAAVDFGLVLGAYGLREPGDVDFLCARAVPSEGRYEHHAPDRYDVPLGDLLQDSAHHFHFWDTKFLSLGHVVGMKRRRGAD